jgi:hypothetical protein
MDFTKVVRIGTARTYGGRAYSVYCEIEYKGGKLSITGVEGPLASGNCLGGCGQIDMHDWGIVNYAPGWDAAKEYKFRRIWERWHLNDLRAGCEHQRALGWDNLHIGDPCPTCGYRYGTAWLREDVPADVLDWLRSLPETDQTPAWL